MALTVAGIAALTVGCSACRGRWHCHRRHPVAHRSRAGVRRPGHASRRPGSRATDAHRRSRFERWDRIPVPAARSGTAGRARPRDLRLEMADVRRPVGVSGWPGGRLVARPRRRTLCGLPAPGAPAGTGAGRFRRPRTDRRNLRSGRRSWMPMDSWRSSLRDWRCGDSKTEAQEHRTPDRRRGTRQSQPESAPHLAREVLSFNRADGARWRGRGRHHARRIAHAQHVLAQRHAFRAGCLSD